VGLLHLPAIRSAGLEHAVRPLNRTFFGQGRRQTHLHILCTETPRSLCVLGSLDAGSFIEMLLKAETRSFSLPRAGNPATISNGAV
jgi:hypothetical protein